MSVITNSKVLANLCKRLSEATFVTVDTEFLREKTFWPHLCLVQVAGPDDVAAIDPLADGIDLTPLFDLLSNPKVLKVFHAARQDLEIFHHMTGKVPAPMFDTQVAAMVCGFGDSVSYETLVNRLAKGKIDKSSRFTDWSHRPLSTKQINYALADVIHLRPIYEKLKRKLDESGRAGWLDEEMAVLMDPVTYEQPPENAWKRIKGRGHKPRVLGILREVAAWRESEAQSRDIPRNRMLRDEALLEIAHHTPKTVDDLARIRGLGRGLAEGANGQLILKAVARGLALKDDELPDAPVRPDLPGNIGPVIDLLKVFLKMKCQDNEVASKLVATSDDIEQIAGLGKDADVAALHGWRYEMFGKEALDMRAGKIGIVIEGKRLKTIKR
ncbi:MAG: ribonuclease D [Rhodospirillales bacterium]|nr:ribonuclease D [Rhodospirillales bacterium]MCW8951186.1 ribonuclease D [Rhodospirillales bacterium]MCW8971060.1 ribonuclease D [Rhodospirillales bacterium]